MPLENSKRYWKIYIFWDHYVQKKPDIIYHLLGNSICVHRLLLRSTQYVCNCCRDAHFIILINRIEHAMSYTIVFLISQFISKGILRRLRLRKGIRFWRPRFFGTNVSWLPWATYTVPKLCLCSGVYPPAMLTVNLPTNMPWMQFKLEPVQLQIKQCLPIGTATILLASDVHEYMSSIDKDPKLNQR